MTQVLSHSIGSIGPASSATPVFPMAHSPVSASTPRPVLPRLEILSPVNQNGSFEFDRVIRSGEVVKRSRKTKQWKRFYLVLRPKQLSIYKNSSEERLHKKIALSDLTAVAMLKDPKGRREHLFGLFTTTRNYHFQADNGAGARDWVDAITHEARLDEDEHMAITSSPGGEGPSRYSAAMRLLRRSTEPLEEEDVQPPSSPEPCEAGLRQGVRIPVIRKTSMNETEFSGTELMSYSDLSDAPTPRSPGVTSVPLSRTTSGPKSPNAALPGSPVSFRPAVSRNGSYVSTRSAEEEERVIWSGYLLALRSKGGVRQWRKLWVVIRPKHVAFYKNEEEYAARLIIPMANMINAVELDPLSRTKAHCFQLIAEDKTYRLCASDDESLSRCLGALKSQLARRKERHTFGMSPR